ncbi:MAG: PQQ-binding-like beta-propeller repeat protein [Deltaproteobacteria bacterium]|nr:PQQ-binding-like beta-propeller repeat protein [Deltaproteobacteria bacterium]
MSLALAMVLAAADLQALRPAVPPQRVYSVAWQRSLAPADLLDWQLEESGSPAVDAASRTVVAGARGGVLRAFRDDGTELWDYETGGGFAGGPLIQGGTVYAGSLDGALFALDLASGKPRWRVELGLEVGATPILVKGLLIVATLQDEVVAVDAATGARKWHHRRDREGMTIRGCARPVLARGLVIAAYSDGSVVGLDPASGAARWERKVAPAGEFVDVDGLAADDRAIYAAAYSGAVLALDAESGKTLWEKKEPGATRLAAGDGQVYVSSTARVAAYSARDGALRWSQPLQGMPAAPALRAGSRLLVPSGKGMLVLDPGSGKPLRTFEPGTGVSATPAALGRRVYTLSNAGALTALDLE